MAPFWLASARLARRIETDLVHTMGAITPGPVDLVSVQFCHAAFQAMPNPSHGDPVGLSRRINKAVARRMAIDAERWCYRPTRTRKFAAASAGIQAELARHYPDVPSTVIPNAADHTRFRPDPELRAAVRSQLGVSEDSVVVLFLGGDWGRKGLRVTIDGIGEARRAGATSVVLWVVGRGDVSGYQAHARTVEDSAWCTFHGFSREPERFLAAADVFISPTTYEAFPLAALEAAACGVPVVATSVNGIAELIRDGQEGLIVSRDASSIARAIRTLAGNPAMRARMGVAACASARRYTWDAVARRTLDAYDELLRSAWR
jgi:glycosyltransferase involved in cell wall biosynthesis